MSDADCGTLRCEWCGPSWTGCAAVVCRSGKKVLDLRWNARFAPSSSWRCRTRTCEWRKTPTCCWGMAWTATS